MTWIHTSRGRALDLLDPDPDAVCLIEIAGCLSKICRYTGHTRRFYSVAEHSYLMSQWVEAECGDRDLALAALLHDAAEAYMGDLTWPMQVALWDDEGGLGAWGRVRYRKIQRRLDRIIADRAGLPVELLSDRRIKEADLRILIDERDALLGPPPRPWPVDAEMGLEPLGVIIMGLDPNRARGTFLLRLQQLGVRRES